MISIITPVYNTEKYLPRCLDSILAQSYQDWELLLIDDGSTDGSDMICDEYAARDTRIRVFHKENGGVASVRQLGIEQARGKYSIHVDSDDWIEPRMLEEMLEEAIKIQADIIVADFYKEYNGNIILQQQRSKDNAPTSLLEDIVKGRQMGALWNKLIRHSLYNIYNVSFTKGINLGEDALVLAQLLQHSVKVHYQERAYYHYMDNGDSTLCRGFDRKMYATFSAYQHKMLEIVPDDMKEHIRSNIRCNEVKAMQHKYVSASDLRKNKFRLQFKDIFRKSVGNEYRMIILLYLMGLDNIIRKRINRTLNE